MVQMAGPAGYDLKGRFGWVGAASLLFERAHPGWPQQNYGAIPQAWALAHIEVMAEREAAEAQETTATVKE
jgi:pyruvate/2-oxoglutarate dehydrogenase complex dihydrolipoamide dehydrogenase (E3) component